MHRDSDLDLESELPPGAGELGRDLELGTILDAMADGDAYLRDVAERALLTGLADPDDIVYRQQVLADCIDRPATVRQLYDLAVEGVEARRNSGFYWFRESPDALLHKSRGMLALLVEVLRRVRQVADEHGDEFTSEGFTKLFETLQRELDDAYFAELEAHLEALRFRRGTLLSAELGRGSRGARYVLRTAHPQAFLDRLGLGGPERHHFTVPSRDDYGLQALSELRGRGINLVGNALAQSTDHILEFFAALRAELGFYLACTNLHEKLHGKGLPTCFPRVLGAEVAGFAAHGLYDPALAFHLDAPVVGSDVAAECAHLVMITGANQGGKSTFLRSVGLAQLLTQAGAFAPAVAFRAGIRTGLFTHFSREEDPSMTRGKLEEELQRMSVIAGEIGQGGLLLCNESFASTNEREGSEIAQNAIRAMLDGGVRVVFVTHLFQLAHTLHARAQGQDGGVLFLRAERRPDGVRTFQMVPGEPLGTSFAEDSYRRVFGELDGSSAVGVRSGPPGILRADTAG